MFIIKAEVKTTGLVYYISGAESVPKILRNPRLRSKLGAEVKTIQDVVLATTQDRAAARQFESEQDARAALSIFPRMHNTKWTIERAKP